MSNARRVLFVGRSIGHFSYYESILAALLERGAHVDYIADKEWSTSWAGGDQSILEFQRGYPNLKTGWASRRSDRLRDFIFPLRELRSYRSYITRPATTPFYIERWAGYLTPEWKKRIDTPSFVSLLKSRAAGVALKLAERLTPADARLVEEVERYAPDVMVVSPANMRHAEEVDYLKAAHALGVPTAVPVLSWDNLSTKGLLHVTPSLVFVWNEFQLDDARRIQHLPQDRIRVSGSPFFDKWFSPPADSPTREAFCASIGFDPARPILLYLGSSRNIARDESWFVEKLADALRGAADPKLASTQVLVRPHPANAKIYHRLALDGVLVWPRDGELPETEKSFADMRNSFLHADASVGINTSGMIDAVLADLPTFTVTIPQYAATQTDSVHFRHLSDAGAMTTADDLPAFVKMLGETLRGNDDRATARRTFATKFARPAGLERSAGDVIAEAVLELGSRGRA